MIHTLDLQFLGQQKTIAAFLVETVDGPILFETGPHSTFPKLEKELGRHGYTIFDIQHVFLTHIHLDHAGAAWVFAKNGAKIYVHPFGARHLAAPERLMNSAKQIYKEKMDELWGQMEPIPTEQIHAIEDEAILRIGDLDIKAWHTPGHASHHIAWQIHNELITGDVAGVKIGEGIVVPPCPPPDINLEDWETSIQLMKQMQPKALYLTHFGKVTDVNNHLNNLSLILHDWANWIKPYWEEGADPANVTALFQAYTHGQLVEAGIPEEDLPRYESANPSWMSVVGLMRYWSKKGK